MTSHTPSAQRFLGIDMGSETIKVIEIEREEPASSHFQLRLRRTVEHHKDPSGTLKRLLLELGWSELAGAAVTGRLGRSVALPRVPMQQARSRGFRFHVPSDEATLVSIGSRGFSVLELRRSGVEVLRENTRCSQGTGNFLQQLVQRFDLGIEEASALCEQVKDPSPLSGRCPVILKTDMTHLANAGVERARILAGLFDAVSENVEVLLKPRSCPPRVLLSGGVARSPRVQAHFDAFLARHGMERIVLEGDAQLYLEALGCALAASDAPSPPPAIDEIIRPATRRALEMLPALSSVRDRVHHLQAPPPAAELPRVVVLGLDIGSTGSKLVALDPERCAEPGSGLAWQAYGQTLGNPIVAAQALMRRFVEGPLGGLPVLALGVTGSGREIVGSLASTCYGPLKVFVLNEIAAHAEGALHYDPRVDTIFEIGGQDAKYIRLDSGRVVEAAMNEACSAGTGSFIEEQGRRFSGIRDVVQLGQVALQATEGVSLGQHCSVFMAEVLDEAVSEGVETPSIIAGIYDSVIQNYLNRVKGNRSVGQVIFCQGMPFAADALAAAVARQTGSEILIPPNPGTIGALGIALLTRKKLELHDAQALDLERFLNARLESRDSFVCRSVQGCGGAGNRCRIDRLNTEVEGERRAFTWGGGCSLYDRGSGRIKLPDRAPDPFRARDEELAALSKALGTARGRPRIGLTSEFLLRSMFPFFATFLSELGFDLVISGAAGQAALKRGIEEANVPFCAPMQQYHGIISALFESEPALDWLFLPMIRSLPRIRQEQHAVLCPIVQASPEILRWNLRSSSSTRLLLPVVDVGRAGWRSEELAESCLRIAVELGARGRLETALALAIQAQERHEAQGLELGRAALSYARERDILPVIVLGRPYTIYNRVLNSNVPTILREQGTIAIPLDCYPVAQDIPMYERAYWGYEHRILRAARQVRQEPGTYSLWCSNYACGPDSFGLHYYASIMEGKPFAVIETDGHSGDAGTRTRVEAFLHCARQDREREQSDPLNPTRRLTERMGIDTMPSKCGLGSVKSRRVPIEELEHDRASMSDIRRAGEIVLIPRMGPGNEVVAACLRGIGVPAEGLPMPDVEAMRLGRRYSSGKECVPMSLTLGSLLQRIERSKDSSERFAFFMPEANGPCRFGSYNLLQKMILDQIGWRDRVRIWSPQDNDYFRDTPPGFAAAAFCGFMAIDLLLEGLYHCRPVETRPGAAREVFERASALLHQTLEERSRAGLSIGVTARSILSDLFGCRSILEQASREYAAIRRDRDLPTVLVVGEIYVRCDPFANGFVIEELERRGLRARFAPFNEWIEYTDSLYRHRPGPGRFARVLRGNVQDWIRSASWKAMAEGLGWGARTTVEQSVKAASSYIRGDLRGEAVLTLGGPLHEWREGLIDGAVSVGPLECMPGKIAEAQFFHSAEREGLPALCLSLNGDPIDREALDAFAFQVHRVHSARSQAKNPHERHGNRKRGPETDGRSSRTLQGS